MSQASKPFETQDLSELSRAITEEIEVNRKELKTAQEIVERMKSLDESNQRLQKEIDSMQELLSQSLENERVKWETIHAEKSASVLRFDYVNRSVE